MSFDFFFKLVSFAVVFCGFFALVLSGGVGIFVSVLFLIALIFSWFAENSRWQISERLGTVLMFIAVPLFYFGWKNQLFGSGTNASAVVSILAKLVLLLTVIKLLQKKSERDWLFLYLMSFFEVLLSAGISISPLFFASVILYLLVTLCAVIVFEIRKTSQNLQKKITETKINQASKKIIVEKNLIFRLSSMAIILLILMTIVAMPLFFTFPRVGGAGLGNNQSGLSGITGFSDSVRLGEIGRLKQSDEIVLRARVENLRQNNFNIARWRGVALDKFDNRNWSKLNDARTIVTKENGGFINAKTSSQENIVTQTIYLEPLDSTVIFAFPKLLGVDGNGVQNVVKDKNDGFYFMRSSFDRLIYKTYSDTNLPSTERLQADNAEYSEEIKKRYLQIPENFNEKIGEFSAQLTQNQKSRYDKAKAVEKYLQNNLGYTLDLRVNSDDPLADFLFNVREGHCEYFASAMAMMLRTQGIATRIVNGFQQGEFNEAAGVFVVKQKDAHSWVEVYFPSENVWVPFDPTPFAGQTNPTNYAGTFGSVTKYLEAIETFWIQYFVAFDNQEQRSLFSSVKSGFQDYQTKSAVWLNQFQEKISDWWREVRGDKGTQTSLKAILYGIGYLFGFIFGIILFIWIFRKFLKSKFLRNIFAWLKRENESTIVEFYERMQKALAQKGFERLPHQTPLEFAFETKMPVAVKITEKYNQVRFGEKNLSTSENEEIENWLKDIEQNNKYS